MDIEVIYQRILNHMKFYEWKHQILSFNRTDNIDKDNFFNDGIAQIKLKNDLKKNFYTLTKNNYHNYLVSKNFSFVFLYLPCKFLKFK